MSWRIFQYTLLTVMLAGNSLCLAANDAAFLKSVLNKPEKIWLGQQLDLNVTLYTTTSFAGVPRFDTPKDSGLVIIVDDSHPLLGSETIDGISYISKQYSISLFPLRAGDLTLPSFQVEFGYQGENGQQANTSAATTVQQFTVLDVPNHDATIPLITAEELKIDDRWNPQPGKAVVGDSFSRTVTMTATGLPGMAFPPLAMKGAEGIAVYPGQPQVSTDTERGDYIGKRVETFSYVCEKAGTFTLAEMKIQWWNPSSEDLQVVKLSAVTLRVAPNLILKTSGFESAAGSSITRPWLWVAAIGGLGVLAVVCVLLLRRMRLRFVPHNLKTEKEFFKKLKLAAETDDVVKTMKALIRWLDATGFTGGLSDFMGTIGDPELTRQLIALEMNVYGRQKVDWSGRLFFDRITLARKKLHSHSHTRFAPGSQLEPLNP